MQEDLGRLILRGGIGIVFILLGFDKFPHPADWLVYISPSLSQFLSQADWTAYAFLRVQGVIELILGLHLLVGFLARFAALGCSVLLALITYSLGWDHTGIRDWGLLICSIAIFFLGPGNWSADALIKGQKKHE